MDERFWYRVTRKILRAGPFPTIVNDGHIKIRSKNTTREGRIRR